MARKRFVQLEEPERWAQENVVILNVIWDRFAAGDDWPNGRLLQRELFTTGPHFVADEFARSVPPMLGRLDSITGKVHLTPRGLSFVAGARPLLDQIPPLVELGKERYADTKTEPVISSTEFEGLLGLTASEARHLTLILLEDAWLFRAAGGSVAEGQRFEFDENTIVKIGEIKTLEDYLYAQAEAFYPPPSTQAPVPGSIASRRLPKVGVAGPQTRPGRYRNRGAFAAAATAQPRHAKPSWWNRHRTNIGVIATVIAAIGTVIGLILAFNTGSGNNGSSGAGKSGASGQVYAELEPGPHGAPVVMVHGRPITYIDLYNHMPTPVYKAIVSLVYIQGGPWQTGRQLDRHPRDPAGEFQRDVQSVPPGRSRISVSGDWGALSARPGAEIAYQDASGQSWLRTATGKLYRIKESPPAYYGLNTPLDWIEPQPVG